MLRFALLPALAALCAAAPPDKDAAQTILAMERAAMERAAQGDPMGFIEISDVDVTYFDPFIEKRIDGRPALKTLYEKSVGERTDSYEFIDPKVQVSGDAAVLTFNFVSRSKKATVRWNATEVYRRRNGQWRIVHTHWSFTNRTPPPKQ